MIKQLHRYFCTVAGVFAQPCLDQNYCPHGTETFIDDCPILNYVTFQTCPRFVVENEQSHAAGYLQPWMSHGEARLAPSVELSLQDILQSRPFHRFDADHALVHKLLHNKHVLSTWSIGDRCGRKALKEHSIVIGFD